MGRLRKIWSGTGGVWPEAPHLLKIGKHLLFAHNGRRDIVRAFGRRGTLSHTLRALRALSPQPDPHLAPRPRHPIQATGHADWVELADGTWWAVLLGIRPRRGRHHHLGRETFYGAHDVDAGRLAHDGQQGRVELEMTAPELPFSPVPAPSVRDDFDASTLEPLWTFLRNPSPAIGR